MGMPAIERIIISRETFGAEPHLRFSVSDRQSLQQALSNQHQHTSRKELLVNLLTRMGQYAGQNLPYNWKEVFLSGETFSWEFLPGSESGR